MRRPTQHRSRLALSAAALTAVAVTAGAGCGGGGDRGTRVSAALRDYDIQATPFVVPPGPVTFAVVNASATLTHELLVVRTDRAPGDLPLGPDGHLDSRAPGIAVLGGGDDLAPGATATFTVGLDPGDYLLVCDIDDHLALGMVTGFKVR